MVDLQIINWKKIITSGKAIWAIESSSRHLKIKQSIIFYQPQILNVKREFSALQRTI